MLVVKEVAPASYLAGSQFVTGALASLKTGIVVAAPYAAVGLGGAAVVGVGGYYTYRHFYPYIPTEEEQKAEAEHSFYTCLNNNAKGKMNESGFPTTCENYARAYALMFGDEQTQQKIEIFKKYNPESLS